MTNVENVHELMEKMSKGKETANQVLFWDPPTRRLRVAPADQVAKKDVAQLGIEDMKVSGGKTIHESVLGGGKCEKASVKNPTSSLSHND